MSTGWIWTFWTALMLVWIGVSLAYDMGTNELWIFMGGTILLSAGAALLSPKEERGTIRPLGSGLRARGGRAVGLAPRPAPVQRRHSFGRHRALANELGSEPCA
jgi:hypothetical protein